MIAVLAALRNSKTLLRTSDVMSTAKQQLIVMKRQVFSTVVESGIFGLDCGREPPQSRCGRDYEITRYYPRFLFYALVHGVSMYPRLKEQNGDAKKKWTPI